MAATVTETFEVQVGPTISSYVSVVEVAPVDYGIYVGLGFLAFFLGTVTFGLRMYVRSVMIKTFGLDDWILVAAYVTFVGLVALFIAIPAEILAHGLQDAYFTSVGLSNIWLAVYGVVSALVRIATAAFFLRVVPAQTLYKWHRFVLISVVSAYAVFSVVVGFVLLGQCGMTWPEVNMKLYTDKCFDTNTMYDLLWALAVATAVADWAMTLIPIAVVFKGAMSTRTKRTSAPVILLAALGGIVSIIRIPFNDYFVLEGPQSMPHYMIWLTLALYEMCIALAATSLAATRPLLQKWLGAKQGSSAYASFTRPNAYGKSTITVMSKIQVTRGPAVTTTLKDDIAEEVVQIPEEA
ncbi:hypothetical protein K461DRAFT_320581 [Myriangium duriaei CBS 260.36]|uniref:Rhodopsin domain-containing protein n=1 Tax=Myriangium duriaei CBS 260.36 TaxID=1168546 RepID=A0A9P4MH85_9PEZI|nr:hypothetical protein K461DRAFT_320581 [Myriangium duriaei CBS 260.36]